MADDIPENIPRYRHNCPLCKFLGSLERDGRVWDLYYCNQGHMLPTVIARQSGQPHDYVSGLAMARHDPILYEAFVRAQREGLLPVDISPEDATLGEES